MYVSHHVLTVDRQCRIARQAQRGVQHGAILRGVDVFARVHRIAALFQPGRAGQIHQQCQRLAVDPVLAVVDVEVADGQGQIPAAVVVGGEELPQRGVCDLVMMATQGFPGGTGGGVCTHSTDPMRTAPARCR